MSEEMQLACTTYSTVIPVGGHRIKNSGKEEENTGKHAARIRLLIAANLESKTIASPFYEPDSAAYGYSDPSGLSTYANPELQAYKETGNAIGKSKNCWSQISTNLESD